MKNTKKQTLKCHACGSDTQELEEFDGKKWCPTCLGEKTNLCDTCESRFYDQELTTFDSQLWCRDCLDEETTHCSDCGERVYVESVSYVSDEPICESCYDNNYFQCENCGQCCHNDDYGEDGHCRYCGGCKAEAQPDDKRYYSRSRKDPTVGVEIEAEGGSYSGVYDDLANEGFGVQTDGSLDSEGIEVQVPASNGDNTRKLVLQACQSLKDNGFDVSKRCGLHVHIEYLSRMKTIKRLLLMVYACEPVFYAINPKGRQDNDFCQPLRKAFSAHEIIQAQAKDIDKLYYSKKYTGLSESKVRDFKRSKWNQCRYFGFNLHSLFYQKTVEFRYHAGTISHQKIMYWIELLKAILLYVRFRYNQGEVLGLIEQPTPLSKMRYMEDIMRLDDSLANYLVSRYIFSSVGRRFVFSPVGRRNDRSRKTICAE